MLYLCHRSSPPYPLLMLLLGFTFTTCACAALSLVVTYKLTTMFLDWLNLNNQSGL